MTIKGDQLTGLTEDISVLKEDVSVLKTDVSALKRDTSETKTTVNNLVTAVANLNSQVSQMATKKELDQKFNQILNTQDKILKLFKNHDEEHAAFHHRVYQDHEPRITHLESQAI